MRATQLFTKTSKNIPADETSKNAQLLIKAGFIYKQLAGVYVYLPLGKIVLDKIINIIRKEMNAIGGNEVSMTALQPKEVWETSGRWSDDVIDVWFKTALSNGTELGLAPTHEEPLTVLMKNFISSYKDLPVYPYQFQIKYRNELRSKSGLMRGREFWMKDLYSFSSNQKEHDEFYDKVTQAYFNIFRKMGLGDYTYKTFASGGAFSKYSHEFQTVSEVGEDLIYISQDKQMAINEEVLNDDVLDDLGLKKEDLQPYKAVEVGNIFTLGTKFSDPVNLKYSDEKGNLQSVIMGSYGVGPSRLMGLIAEHFADDRGLVWPESVAPFKVYLVQIGQDEAVNKEAEVLYNELTGLGVEVYWDDRDARPGEKFADADLFGIPYRIVVSTKTIDNNLYEFKSRTKDNIEFLNKNSIIKLLAK